MPDLKNVIAKKLTEARARTLLLVASLTDDDLRKQHDPLMSPILWDLGHIVHFEELWLTHNLRVPGDIELSEMPGMYNPFEHPRSTRAALPLPALEDLLRVAAEVRAEVLDALQAIEFDPANPLLRDGFVYDMVLQHEYQHNETMLQTLQLKQGVPYRAPRISAVPGGTRARFDTMVCVAAGAYGIGTDDRSSAYDNERPAHTVRLSAFEIDAAPVTNTSYAEFMRDGGYTRPELWSDAGRVWLGESGAVAPKYWYRDGNSWMVRGMNGTAPIVDDHPVCHVCFHEAQAYARWVDKRLPTEFEWEVAAGWNPDTRAMQRFPWGDAEPTALHANLDQLQFGTSPVGAYPSNVSPLGCYGMIGDIWEWTSGVFTGYPGFRAFPYPEYSEAFFGSEYRVLRGGSWASRPGAIRNTFRNWDFPVRRQIFSGFRCARDV